MCLFLARSARVIPEAIGGPLRTFGDMATVANLVPGSVVFSVIDNVFPGIIVIIFPMVVPRNIPNCLNTAPIRWVDGKLHTAKLS